VEPLRLWTARAAAGRTVAMYGYLAAFRQGLHGRGTVLGLAPSDGRQVLQLRSEEATHGYSGGPIWQPEWGRVIGMVKQGLTADEMGKHGNTTLGVPTEALAEGCPDRLTLTPPESLIVQATRHISGANRDLVDGYTARPFFGRDDSLQRLDRWREKNPSGRMVVTALAGFGKTALLANWLRHRQASGDFAAFHFFSNRDDNLRPLANAYANLLGQLSVYYGLPDETLPEENARESRLRALIDGQEPAASRPLIILLDALDECDRLFQLPLPHTLPDGVYVVASARAPDLEDDGDVPAYLEGWLDGATTFHLDRLPPVAQAGWLGAVGQGVLREESQDPEFLARLDQVSDGYPLYLRYLLEDLVEAKQAGRSPRALLDQPARGFGDYAVRQLRVISQAIKLEKEVQEFFVLLAVARYPLNEDEVTDLTGLSYFDLTDLPPGLTRWLNIGRDEQERRLYALAHARLTDEFEQALRGAADKKRQELLAWCARVADHRLPYALRYRADLLLQAQKYDALHALAMDRDYAALQQAELPSEPDLPLSTVRLTLQAAADQGQAVHIVEALTEHARRIGVLRGVSPLAALRTTPGAIGLSSAWTLADANNAEGRTLWLLLLAWELAANERAEEAESTLARLRSGPLPLLELDAEELAAQLIRRLLPRWPVLLTEVSGEVLSDRHLERLANSLLDDELLEEAAGLSGVVRDFDASEALQRRVAVAFAYGGDYQTADMVLNSMRNDWQIFLARRQIAVNAARRADFEGARHYLAMVDSVGLKVGGAGFVAEALAGQGQPDEAAALFDQALQQAHALADAYDRALAFKDLAMALAGAGRPDDAAQAVKSALQAAEPIDDSEAQQSVLARIALVQVSIGPLEGALATAARIEDEEWRVDTLYDMGARCSALGRPADALALSRQLAQERDRSMLAARVAVDQAQAGDFQGAGQTIEGIGRAEDRLWALNQLAVAQYKAGQSQDVVEKLQAAALLLDDIDDNYARARAACDMAEAYVTCGDETAAKAFFEAALTDAGALDRHYRRHSALIDIAKAQGRSGHEDRARDILAGVLGDMAGPPGQEGDPEHLPTLLAETLAQLGLVLAQAGDADNARETFGAALAAVEALPAESDPDELLAAVGIVQAQAGQRPAAEQTMALTDDPWAVDQIRQQIALRYLADGDLDQAGQVAATIGDTLLAAAAYGAIGLAANERDQEPVATDSFQAALARADQAGVSDQRVRILAQLARDLAGAEKPDQAATALKAALETAEQLEPPLNDIAIGRVAEVQAAIGLTAEAWATLDRIEEEAMRPLAHRLVAVALALAGNLKNANEVSFPLHSSGHEASLARVQMAMGEAAFLHGDQDEVNQLLSSAEWNIDHLSDRDDRHELLSELAVVQVRVKWPQEAVTTAGRILADRERFLPSIARALAEAGTEEARTAFSQLLPLCAGEAATALAICPAIARRYPDQAAAVAQFVANHTWT
jgi:hypothetical protein